jgi:hypothetical protein
MVLLDYPDSEGVTRELVIGYPRRLLTSRPLLALATAAVLALCAVLAGRTVLRSGAAGPAPDVHLPVVPFPSASAGSSPSLHASAAPPLNVSLRGDQLTPSAARAGASAVAVSPAASTAPAVTPSSAAASAQQAVAVKYLIVGQADGGFQFEGEVSVVNEGSAPISGWQITVALPDDQFTAVSGASGYVSNHILLMQPEPGSGPLEPGGSLRVFFAAQGPEMTPRLCAFNNTICG